MVKLDLVNGRIDEFLLNAVFDQIIKSVKNNFFNGFC